MRRWATVCGVASAIAVCAGTPGAATAAHLVVIDSDGAGEGLNDPTPVAPAGGNGATTRGGARLAALQYAADLWSQRVDSSVDIEIGATFDALTCTPTSAVLGSAGPTTSHRDFTSAPLPGVWYTQAAANALARADLDPADHDIAAHFNATLDGGSCLGGKTWYYGLDGHPPSGSIDFVTVALHELSHGLGFITFVDLASGAKLAAHDDAYMVNLERHGASPSAYPQMTDAQRVAASKSEPQLQWTGTALDGAAVGLGGGVSAGHVELHGPSTQAPGSSVSHFSTAVAPDELMEPFFTGTNHDLALTADLLYDVGWRAPPPAVAVPGVPAPARGAMALVLAVAGGCLVTSRRRLR